MQFVLPRTGTDCMRALQSRGAGLRLAESDSQHEKCADKSAVLENEYSKDSAFHFVDRV
jgi:hypothetical protein